jgi:hypothetical protein
LIAFFFHVAHADSWTGVAQPLEGPVSECTQPPSEIRDGTSSAVVVSEFTYRACREYRSSKTKTLYYVVENVPDGEYVRMIPAPGKTAINLYDYRFNASHALTVCARIRDIVVSSLVPLKFSRCSPQ